MRCRAAIALAIRRCWGSANAVAGLAIAAAAASYWAVDAKQ
jgi:hypothetical protein